MNKIPLIILIFTFANFVNSQIVSLEQNTLQSRDIIVLTKKTHGFLQVYNPIGEHYDDGVFLTKHAAYTIYDSRNNFIINIGESISEPALIKLDQGIYFVKFNNSDNIYEVSVESHIKSEFSLP